MRLFPNRERPPTVVDMMTYEPDLTPTIPDGYNVVVNGEIVDFCETHLAASRTQDALFLQGTASTVEPVYNQPTAPRS